MPLVVRRLPIKRPQLAPRLPRSSPDPYHPRIALEAVRRPQNPNPERGGIATPRRRSHEASFWCEDRSLISLCLLQHVLPITSHQLKCVFFPIELCQEHCFSRRSRPDRNVVHEDKRLHVAGRIPAFDGPTIGTATLYNPQHPALISPFRRKKNSPVNTCPGSSFPTRRVGRLGRASGKL